MISVAAVQLKLNIRRDANAVRREEHILACLIKTGTDAAWISCVLNKRERNFSKYILSLSTGTFGLRHVQRNLGVLRAKRETEENEVERDLRLYTAN